MVVRHCSFTMPDGQLCKAAPLVKGNFCYLHEPAKATEAAESRRLGGLRRRREKTITQIYDLEGLDTISGILRVLEIAVTDALHLENSVPRDRALISAAMAAAKLIRRGEDEGTLRSLGLGVGYKQRRDHEVRGFEDDPDSGEPSAMGRGAPGGRLVKLGDSLLPEAVVLPALREAALAMAARRSATGPTKPATPASTGSKTRRRRPPPSGG
jgi:hypothetical protein